MHLATITKCLFLKEFLLAFLSFLTAKLHSLYVKESELEILERSENFGS